MTTLAEATSVPVVSGAPAVEEIDAEMKPGAKIEGTVTEAGSSTPLAGIEVAVYEAAGRGFPIGYATTKANGEYVVQGLSTGSYKVEFSPGVNGAPVENSPEGPLFEPEGLTLEDFVRQYYRDAPTLQAASAVSVTQGETEGEIDAAMLRGGEIEGTVTDASTHAPLRGVSVVALGAGETEASFATTDANGHYVLAGLESGSYTVAFSSSSHYIAQFYSGQPTFALANPVPVTRPLVTASIDAALVPKAPANTAAPVASGTPAVGQTLSCARGTWTGSPAPTYSYAWLRDGTPIAGASATTYTVQAADQGNGVTCRVTATNRNGSAAAISNTLIVPAPSPPPPPPQVRVVGTHISVRGRSARVELLCAGSRCQGTLELVQRLTIRHRHRRARHESVILGGATYVVQAGQTATVVVPLNNRGRHALAHARRRSLKAEVRVTLVGATSTRQAVSLSAVRHR